MYDLIFLNKLNNSWFIKKETTIITGDLIYLIFT